MATASDILNKSYIGTIDSSAEMLAGGTFGEYRQKVEQALDKVLAVLPGAVAQVGAEDAGIQAGEIFQRLVNKIGKSDYWTIKNGQRTIATVTIRNLDDIKHMIAAECK